MSNIPRPSLTITNLRVQAISHTRSLTLIRRQSLLHAPVVRARPVRARFDRTTVALVSASVMAWKSGARAAAASFCCASDGFSGAAVSVLSTPMSAVQILFPVEVGKRGEETVGGKTH